MRSVRKFSIIFIPGCKRIHACCYIYVYHFLRIFLLFFIAFLNETIIFSFEIIFQTLLSSPFHDSGLTFDTAIFWTHFNDVWLIIVFLEYFTLQFHSTSFLKEKTLLNKILLFQFPFSYYIIISSSYKYQKFSPLYCQDKYYST